MRKRDTKILGEDILQAGDLDPLRRYFREAREGVERIYQDASDEMKQRHYRILSKDLVARGVQSIERQLQDDDRELLKAMQPDIERIVLDVFEEEFGLKPTWP